MKYFIRILVIVALLGTGLSCETFELDDLTGSPSTVPPDQANLEDIYFAVQGGFIGAFSNVQVSTGGVARMFAPVAFTYEAFASASLFTGLWETAYAGLFPDVDVVIQLAEKNDFDIHAGTAKILKAYTLILLVDIFGDVPYSEMGKGTEILSPKIDKGADIYAAALVLLDEAIEQLRGTTAAAPVYDNFYAGDTEKWIALAKTLKFKAALNKGDQEMLTALAKDTLISSAGEDFQVNFGNKRNNPDSRHPLYASHYETDDGIYLSNYYMWTLRAEKRDANNNVVIDPRIRYYFYRKVNDALNQDPTTYNCHLTSDPLEKPNFFPGHWPTEDPRLPYCIAANDGYSGRDHLNGSGIPPDGPIRTSLGLYPYGGKFDDDSFGDTRRGGTLGAKGEGIWPIMLSSFVNFMKAEAILRGLVQEGDAKDLLKKGIEASMAKVRKFEDLIEPDLTKSVTLKYGTKGTIADLYAMKDADITNYVNLVLAAYDAAANDEARLDIVIKEFYIAAWGNGIEAYNMYRRTGYPSNIQPALEASPGDFPYTFRYPSNFITRNSNAEQKALADKVFWDPGKTLK